MVIVTHNLVALSCSLYRFTACLILSNRLPFADRFLRKLHSHTSPKLKECVELLMESDSTSLRLRLLEAAKQATTPCTYWWYLLSSIIHCLVQLESSRRTHLSSRGMTGREKEPPRRVRQVAVQRDWHFNGHLRLSAYYYVHEFTSHDSTQA